MNQRSNNILRWLNFAVTQILFFALVISCGEKAEKETAPEDSPTSGKLRVFCDEAYYQKISLQLLTFESQYPKTDVDLISSTEALAVKALYEDSCELIVIGRDLSASEKKAFQSKSFNPSFTQICVTGLALITNNHNGLVNITKTQVRDLITKATPVPDSVGKSLEFKVVFDKDNSSIMAYVKDSIAKGKGFSGNCSSVGTSLEAIQYVRNAKDAMALIDFALISDQDDSLVKSIADDIRILAVETNTPGVYAHPSQSSFKLNTYPYARFLYVFRKTGDFTLAKGFQSYLAGPKGQLTFLKQGLLPARQGERSVHINLE